MTEYRRRLCSKTMNASYENVVFWRLKKLVPRLMTIDWLAIPLGMYQ